MRGDSTICHLLPDFDNKDVAEHDMQVLTAELQEKFQENCELQDHVARWCHEFKIPLAACFLMEEKIADRKIRKGMREQLEKMNQQINAMMLGCRLQSPVFDLQVKKTSLMECVRTSIKNNQFFLIQKRVEIKLDVAGFFVYTDPSWLVYVLDQLIANAVKYTRSAAPMPDAPAAAQSAEGQISGTRPAEGQTSATPPSAPCLQIRAQKEGRFTCLTVEDNGEGILEKDIRQIFNKGFTGSNHHNGSYRSTGMGLYLAAKICRQMGHQIRAESVYGSFTRFSILFGEDPYLAPGRDG